MPHEGADAVLAGCQLISALHSIVSRNIDPLQGAVVSPTQIHAGDTWNVIPETCIIRGTTRWFDEPVGDTIEMRIAELSNSIAAAFGCSVKLRYERRFPATVNEPKAAHFVRSVADSCCPGLSVVNAPPSSGSEDFAFMLQAVPGCYVWLGAGRKDANHGLHSPYYDFNDEVLPLGIQLWVSLVRRSLGGS
jgi:hippurate hydrolase